MRRKNPLVNISRQAVEDNRLSAKARGLLVWMVAQQEDDVSIRRMSRAGLGGLDAIRSGLEELEKSGYLTRQRHYDEKGQLTGTDYIFTDIPSVRQ